MLLSEVCLSKASNYIKTLKLGQGLAQKELFLSAHRIAIAVLCKL